MKSTQGDLGCSFMENCQGSDSIRVQTRGKGELLTSGEGKRVLLGRGNLTFRGPGASSTFGQGKGSGGQSSRRRLSTAFCAMSLGADGLGHMGLGW